MAQSRELSLSLEQENQRLRAQLAEAEELIRAIRHYEIDALVVATPIGEQVFTLKSADQPYRIFIEQMHEGAATVSEGGVITYANQHLAKMLKLPLERIIGSRLERFIQARDCKVVTELVRAGREGRGRKEFSLRAADGSLIPVYLSASRFCVEDTCSACLVVTDLSELKAAEEAIHNSERLASIGTLATGIGHEINNPLNAILLSARYALETKDDPSGNLTPEAALETVISEAERCSRIVKGLLQFARHEKTRKWPVNFNEAVRHAVDLARSYCTEETAVLLCEFDEALPPVMISATEFDQVVVNLIKNSFEACGGRASITVRTRGFREKVQLIIEDDGPGIPPEVAKRIFDPFYSTRVASGGTGLGLSIVHGIIRDHGGTIWIESEVGKGAAFIIELPAATGGRTNGDGDSSR